LRYAYEDLGEAQFESLITAVCSFLFGPSVQPFAAGKDGGRDARFHGTAENHPSKAEPWVGKSVIQAKHTIAINAHYGDSDFFNPKAKSSTLVDEIPKIISLKEAGELDHYMVFSNRKLTAGTEEVIRKHLLAKCGLADGSVFLVGTEQLELYLRRFPQIHAMAALSPIDAPLIVDVDDLASVIEALAEHQKTFQDVVDDFPTPRVSYDEKNKVNGMSPEYAEVIRRRYLSDTPQVKAFLAHPDNAQLLKVYEDVVDEFELKIVAKKTDYQSFDDVMNYLMDLLFNRDPILRKHKRLTRTVLFYMYWNCDIGSVGNVATN